MPRQLQHIAALYASNRQNWWIVGWVALMALPALAFLAPDAPTGRSGLIATQLIGFPVGGCIFLIFTQAKWQFSSPRARLMPRYAAPHLTVLAVIAVAFIGLMPVVPGLAGYNALGAAAYAAAIASTFLWSMHSQVPLANLAALGLLFSVYITRVADFWMMPDQAARWLPYHLAILAAGWLGIAAWLARLPRMREDSEDYFVPIQGQAGLATRTSRTMASKTLVRQLLKSKPSRWICDVWHDRLAGVRAHSDGARQRLLRYGFGPAPAAAGALWMAAVFFVILWAVSQSAVYRGQSNSSSFVPALNFFILMPGIATLNLLAARRVYMPRELLLPLTRRHYINGVLRATARHAVVSWIVVHAALLLLLRSVAPTLFTWPLVVALTALSAAAQLYVFGATSWVSQSAHGTKRIVLLVIALIPAMVGAVIGLAALNGTTLTREQFDRQTEEEISQSVARWTPVEPPDDARSRARLDLLLEKIAARERAQAEVTWRREQPTPAIAWCAALPLAAVGVAVLIHSRRRWLQLELA